MMLLSNYIMEIGFPDTMHVLEVEMEYVYITMLHYIVNNR